MNIYRSAAARNVASNAAGLIPLAAGRAAVVARELPDSSAVVRMTRGRMWIGVLGTLLVGIVALNVLSLGLNASNGRVGEQINELEQANSALRADIDEKLSSTRVESAAAVLGLATPSPEEISYLDYSDADVTRAAKFLAGDIAAAADPETTSAGDDGTSSTTVVEPVAATVPAPSPAPAPAPAPTSAPAASAPEAASSAPAPPASGSSGGGISAGL